MFSHIIAVTAIAVTAATCSMPTASAVTAPGESSLNEATRATPVELSAFFGRTVEGNTFTIRSAFDSNKCLDVYGSGEGPWVQAWTCNGQANQQWYFVWYEKSYNWEVRSADTWCVDSRNGRGGSLEEQPCTGAATQRFNVYPVDSTLVFESATHPNQVWDIYDHGRGTTVQLWDYNRVPHQRWTHA
ncbi:RICIN domain-containing protein [Amycolatopsis sp. QT-25]|uniref:RICIN domain-containing protein n=1 Tax=Amycolatopsis sp. QT-25 TaxID=3034022 RepID=UPI0023EE19C6|nr:RICIN domain-containing protein [Amycolatopsis sp. QT-25]WET83118.1 RICIN domain-containing protein [Amycolatopsis sp. QT-25]